jgi:hypothetical protein
VESVQSVVGLLLSGFSFPLSVFLLSDSSCENGFEVSGVHMDGQDEQDADGDVSPAEERRRRVS